MNIAITTINYNNSLATIKLLDSLKSEKNKDIPIITVDNDSNENDRAELGAYAVGKRQIEIIWNEKNLGFSGGVNTAIQKLYALGFVGWIVLINNDIVAPDGWMDSLYETLEKSGHCIVALPLSEHGHTIFSGTISWLSQELIHSEIPTSNKLSYVVGAGMAIHTDVIDRIGFFDERYFLYFEDADYSIRAKEAGFDLRIASNLEPLQHRSSETTSRLGSPLLLRYHARNALLFNWLHAPRHYKLMIPFWTAFIKIKQIGKLLLRKDIPQSMAIFSGLWDAISGNWGFIENRPLIAIECESTEDSSWGIARMIYELLGELVQIPELSRKFRINLYFKSHVPDDPVFKNPLFSCHIIRPFKKLPLSFSFYYYVFLPIRLWFDMPAITYFPNYMLPLIFLGKSIVTLTEDVWYEIKSSAMPFRYRLAYKIFANWAARSATRIMAISHASSDQIFKLFNISKERIFVNELGVVAPQSINKKDESNYILYVAQAFPRRHLRETILAFALIAPRYPQLELHIIGPDKYSPPIIDSMIERTNKRLDRVTITRIEQVSEQEVADSMAKACALVYVSDYEAFGLPPIEALSYDTPSVLMDTPLHHEIFDDAAFFVPSGGTEDIADGICRALDDKNHKEYIMRKAPEILARYTWRAHANRFLNEISSILNTQ